MALALTLAVMIFDAKKKRSVAKSTRDHNAIGNGHHFLISLANLNGRRKDRASSAPIMTGTTELGLVDRKDWDASAHNGVDKEQEIYELHSPQIRY